MVVVGGCGVAGLRVVVYWLGALKGDSFVPFVPKFKGGEVGKKMAI